MNRCQSGRKKGFTLIELLVVIAIISILASMLFPAFARAREGARKTVCTSNLRQIGFGVMMYTQDYDEMYPMGYPFFISGKPADQYLSYVVNDYIKSEQVWNCPSWKGKYSGAYNNGNYSFITFSGGGNPIIGVPGVNPTDPPQQYPAALSGISDGTNFPMLFCGIAPQQSSPSSMNAHEVVNDADWDAGTSTHVGGDTIMYADGHSKYKKMTRGTWNTIWQTPR